MLFFLMTFLALTDYQLAKQVQTFILHFLPNVQPIYIAAISIPWFIICLLPCLTDIPNSGLFFDKKKFFKNWLPILVAMLCVLIGLAAFVLLGVTKYFHGVKIPFIFYVITPIVEELLFRGWIYGQVEKRKKFSPILISSALFGLHHLQYFGYHPTTFALFQITYTFFLGILFGFMRKKSGSIYPSLLTHIVINFVTIYF